MSKLTLIIVASSLLLLIVAAVANYENQLTSGFRDSCVTFLDSDKLSDAEAALYIQNLHSEATTFRDRKVLSELEQAWHLSRDADRRDDPYITADVKYGYGISCEDLKKPAGKRQFSEDFDKERCNEETEAKTQRDRLEPEHAEAQKEREEASVLLRKFYSDLGVKTPDSQRSTR